MNIYTTKIHIDSVYDPIAHGYCFQGRQYKHAFDFNIYAKQALIDGRRISKKLKKNTPSLFDFIKGFHS